MNPQPATNTTQPPVYPHPVRPGDLGVLVGMVLLIIVYSKTKDWIEKKVSAFLNRQWL